MFFGPSPGLYGRVRRFHSFRTVVSLVMVLWGHGNPAPAPRAVSTGKRGPLVPMQGDRLEHPVRTRCATPALTKAALLSCRYDCGRSAKTARSTLCSVCFMKNAKSSGARSAGNPKGNIGNAGNMKAGHHAEMAKRSNLKQSARIALVVKKQWLDKILACEKDWEIRGCSTARRGWIHFAESKAGGILVGRARLMDCIRIPRATFESHFCRHRVANVADVPYKNIFAWVFQDPERFAKPFFYKHSPGAVIWVRTSNKRGRTAIQDYKNDEADTAIPG